jgi:hypothetical protein
MARKPKLLKALPEPNDDMFAMSYRLRDLIVKNGPVFSTAYRDGRRACIDAEEYERACDDNTRLQQLLDVAQRGKYTPAQVKKIQKQLEAIFEGEYLVNVVERFDDMLPLITDYFTAKYAYDTFRAAGGEDTMDDDE